MTATTSGEPGTYTGLCPFCEQPSRSALGAGLTWKMSKPRLAAHDCPHGRPCSASGEQSCPQCPAAVRQRAHALAQAREAGGFPEGQAGVVLRLELLRALAAAEEQDPELARIFEHALTLLVLRSPSLVFALAIDKARQSLRWALSPMCERSRVQAYAEQARAHETVASLVVGLVARVPVAYL